MLLIWELVAPLNQEKFQTDTQIKEGNKTNKLNKQLIVKHGSCEAISLEIPFIFHHVGG